MAACVRLASNPSSRSLASSLRRPSSGRKRAKPRLQRDASGRVVAPVESTSVFLTSLPQDAAPSPIRRAQVCLCALCTHVCVRVCVCVCFVGAREVVCHAWHGCLVVFGWFGGDAGCHAAVVEHTLRGSAQFPLTVCFFVVLFLMLFFFYL